MRMVWLLNRTTDSVRHCRTREDESLDGLHREALLESRAHLRATPILKETDRIGLDESSGMLLE